MFAKHRRTRGALARIVSMLQTLVCVLALFGLVPGGHEALENLVHLLHDGHLAHSETHELTAESERCAADTEHGCTPLAHHCDCCVSLIGLPDQPERAGLPIVTVARVLARPPSDTGPPASAIEPLYRPPIDL